MLLLCDESRDGLVDPNYEAQGVADCKFALLILIFSGIAL